MAVSGQVATVSSQEGDRVLLSIPMVGFPEGFRLQPGDRVAVVNEGRGPVAVPLVRSFEAGRASENARGIEASGERYDVSEAAVRYGEGNRVIVFVIEREPGSKGGEQVFAIRRTD